MNLYSNPGRNSQSFDKILGRISKEIPEGGPGTIENERTIEIRRGIFERRPRRIPREVPEEHWKESIKKSDVLK